MRIETNYPGTKRIARFQIMPELPIQKFERVCPVSGFEWTIEIKNIPFELGLINLIEWSDGSKKYGVSNVTT